MWLYVITSTSCVPTPRGAGAQLLMLLFYPNKGTLLLCISVYAVSVDVLTHAVDLHKTALR